MWAPSVLCKNALHQTDVTTVGLAPIWKEAADTYPVAKLGTRETFVQAGGCVWGLVTANWPSLNL